MADVYDRLAEAEGFLWDAGNQPKIWERHSVTAAEAEQSFFHEPFLVVHDAKRSQSEDRFHALGRTASDRKLFVVFTFRERRIRVISARDMNQRERGIYERAQETTEGQAG